MADTMFVILDPKFVEKQSKAVYVGGHGRIILTNKHKVYLLTKNAKGEYPQASKMEAQRKLQIFTTQEDAQDALRRAYPNHEFDFDKKDTEKVTPKSETSTVEKPKTTRRKKATIE